MLRIGGVPEHFNEPLLAAIGASGGSCSFHSYPGGSGAMGEALVKKELDVAVMLTEAAVKFCIEKKGAFKLFSIYVESPLLWGIHVGSGSRFNRLEDVSEPVTFAISRYGSGSHLMAFILAKQMGWKSLKFEIVGNLDGAVACLKKQPDSLFMWEKAMTAPLVEEKLFKRIGELPTPWPCFVVVCRANVDPINIRTLMDLVWKQSSEFKRNRGETIKSVVSKFGIRQYLVEEWFDRLRYAQRSEVTDSDIDILNSVKQNLIAVGQLDKNFESISASTVCSLQKSKL